MNEQRREQVTILLAIAVLVSLAGVVYLSLTAGQSADPYTEFYVLGEEGNASDYPSNLSVGETGTIIIGISNHEHRSVTYRVELRLDGQTINVTDIRVDDGETFEGEFAFTPQSTGRMRLRILLYMSQAPGGEPYRALRLWVTVTG